MVFLTSMVSAGQPRDNYPDIIRADADLSSESEREGTFKREGEVAIKKQTIQTFKSICVTDFLFVWETWLDNVVAVHLGRLGMHPTHTPKPHILLPVCHVEISTCLATYPLSTVRFLKTFPSSAVCLCLRF